MSYRCSACPGKYHPIHGDEIWPCPVVCIGQNPGKQEEIRAARGDKGMVFIGQAGMETNQHFLPLAGLHRNENVALTNAVCCYTDNDRKPTAREVTACSTHFLASELELYNPSLVVMMGSTALSLIPGLSIERDHGFPFKRTLFGKERWFFVTQHPAVGLHDPAKMADSIADFERLRHVLKGDYSTPRDEYPNPDYQDLTGRHDDLETILRNGLEGERVMARDTEYYQEKKSPYKEPFCVTLTIQSGTGYMVRAVDRDGLKILGKYMPQYHSVFHNALADQDVEEAMGLPHVPPEKMSDTMQMASAQQDLSQKLKVLAWRLAGMTMRDYDDVVVPYSRDAVLEWLIEAFDVSIETRGVKYIKKKRKFPKTEKHIAKLAKELGDVLIGPLLSHLQPDGYVHFDVPEDCDTKLSSKLMHIYVHTSKLTPSDSEPYSPWDAFKEQIVEAKNDDGTLKFTPEEVYAVTSRVGPMPKVTIQHVFDRDPRSAIVYACRDSCSTRRIWPILKERSHKYEGRVVPGDIDR